ncbi:MAG: zf-HC2 domain-containing protein [bacterium]|nr:zf-HC2 domain-containing protein [bacterium]
MDCNRMRPLVPPYLDGELTEERAAPLRQHLLECSRCRNFAQSETALKSWFVDPGPVAVPAGFAARVARHAFSGEGPPGVSPSPSTERETAFTGGADAAAKRPDAPLMHFLLQATAIAAALLIALSIGMHRANVPEISNLRANDSESLERVLEELDEMNRSQAGEQDEDGDESRSDDRKSEE